MDRILHRSKFSIPTHLCIPTALLLKGDVCGMGTDIFSRFLLGGGVGAGVGCLLGEGVGALVGEGVGEGVGWRVGEGVGEGVGWGVG